MLTVNKLFEGWVFDHKDKKIPVHFYLEDVCGHTTWSDGGNKRYFANLKKPIFRQVEVTKETLQSITYGGM